MMTGTLTLAGLDGGQVSLPPARLDQLESSVQGRLLRAGEDGWDDAVRIWNAMVAKTPALVVQPRSAADVAAVVRFAGEHGLLLGVKGGGHNISGSSMAKGSIVLDMSRMRGVTVDPAARLAHVGPGCLLGDVDRATQQHGLATVLGVVSEVGVAGLTLGGGFGYLARRFGWAVDNLEEVEIVTADGEVRTASRQEHPDLFWALRGGGGNFGCITRFTFRLHEVGPVVTGGMAVWSADHAGEVLEAYQELTESAPRELSAAIVMRLAPPAPFVPEAWHGKPIIAMMACHSGADPDADLAKVRAVRPPILDLIDRRPYTEQQTLMDGTEPKGLHYYWKTEYLSSLSGGFLDAFASSALPVTSPLSESVIFHVGGAVNEHGEDDGAVGNRDAHYLMGFAADWPPGDDRGELHTAWARDGWERIRRFGTGGNYVNFQQADDDGGRTAGAYRGNYGRLRRIKATWDPDNRFRVNRNVAPAS
jgi:FAD/FMN-containing dehydrogenase